MDISLLNFRLQKYIFFQKQQKIKTNFLFTLFITLCIPIIEKNAQRSNIKNNSNGKEQSLHPNVIRKK